MSRIQASISKVTKPRLAKVYPRTRLFRVLDRGRDVPVTWLSGPAGSGKTTLVANWLDSRKLPCIWHQVDVGDADLATFFYYMGLAARKAASKYKRPLPLFTPEYGLGVPTFTRRYFENLYSRLKPPYVLVFDNYQEIPSDSPFHEIICIGLSALPEAVTALILSRSEPPAAFAGMQAGNKLRLLGWNDLKLTPEESKGIVKLRDAGRPQSKFYEWLHEKTDGWAAGLVLLSRALKTEGIDPEAIKDFAPERVFDYFANELFDRLDRPLQDFLLKTAFVPKITPGLAEELTGNTAAGRILSDLNQRNYFTEKRTQPSVIYQYHTLFREFLMTRAAGTFPAGELTDLRLKAAKLLEAAGQTEDAAELFVQAGAWKELMALIPAKALTFISQGRSKLLEKWITALPDELFKSDSWLNYWLGTCRLPFNPVESRVLFERAFQLFVSMGHDAGALLAWSGAVQTFFYNFDDLRPLDRWIAWLDERGKGASFPSPEIALGVAAGMTSALTWRMPAHPDMQKWADMALSLSKSSLNIEARMRAYSNNAMYYLWLGAFDECSMLISEMKKMIASQPVSPLRSLILKHHEALFYNTSAEFQRQALRTITEGLEESRKTGVYILDPFLYIQGAVNSLNEGDPLRAEEFLSKLEKTLRSNSRAHTGSYLYLSASCYLYTGNVAQAVLSAKKGLALVQETGVLITEALVRLLLSYALHETGNKDEANTELVAAKRAVMQTASAHFEYVYSLTEAYFEYARNNERAGLESLRRAMTLGRQRGFTTLLYFWRPAVMGRLCEKALEAGIEVGYVQNLIRKLNLMPDEHSMEIESWPWAIKIHTLGRFDLFRDDKPVNFSGKIQKKPLEMLKALIAFGGRDVAEDRIIDALWPDTEGDLGHKSFETTLQRLRRLLGNDAALRLQDGQLSLDERLCWVDARAFEEAVRSVECGVRNEKPEKEKSAIENPKSEILQRVERALQLYRGHFLPSDTMLAWSATARERLRSRFLGLIVRAGEALEEAGRWKRAGELFEQGIEKDPACEEFYQQLMLCRKRLGQEAGAVEAYNRCRKMLSQEFGLEPSSRTEEIRMSVMRIKKN